MQTQPRLRERPIQLLRRTRSDRLGRQAKAQRLAYALRNLPPSPERTRRLHRMQDLGYLAEIPTPVQFAVGSLDMFRFFIVPAADDYYRSQGFRFGFHTLLRILDDPASMVDPTGLASHPDAIIGHIMQVVHANPIYDLQLLRVVHDDPDWGMARLEGQVVAMLQGTHPRARSIAAIVEEPDYHVRLLEMVRAFRDDPEGAEAEMMLRRNVVENAEFMEIQRTFGALPDAMKYFSVLPRQPLEGALHLLVEREFPFELARASRGENPALALPEAV